MPNELTELLKDRLSCRSYESTSVENKYIEKILHDDMLVPSTNNRQPWSLVAVRNAEIKNEIASMLKEKGIYEDNHDFLETTHAIYEAPILLCIFNKIVEDESILILQSIGDYLKNILLSATNLGLSTLWIRETSCIEKEIEIMLKKENEHLMACIAIGYEKNKEKVPTITKWYR